MSESAMGHRQRKHLMRKPGCFLCLIESKQKNAAQQSSQVDYYPAFRLEAFLP